MLQKEQKRAKFDPLRPIGEKIRWRAANGEKDGTIEGYEPLGYSVRLDNGKHVIVPEESIR